MVVDDLTRAALAMAEDESLPAHERTEMLMEIAVGLQQRPKSREQLEAAIGLYDRALALCPADQLLLKARLTARRASAVQSRSSEGTADLEEARDGWRAALAVLSTQGLPEEIAEAEMNLGVVLHSLAGAGRALITHAIAAYQRALRTFDRSRFPREFAIVQNNLATAFLAMSFTDDEGRGRMRDALAVQAFEEGLKVVTLVDHPSEYAMLQNNLGNALQYASSGHPVANNLRALEAYEEALKVRRRDTTPVEYANTLANKANCLSNLPDDPERPELGQRERLRQARSCFFEARAVFAEHGEGERARFVAEALEGLERELLAGASAEPRETTEATLKECEHDA
jgi:tetratricopeptide (TPR) repeat protein